MDAIKRVNTAIVLGSVALLAGAFLMTRPQTAIGDAEFPRLMAPHHSGSILMWREAKLRDPEVASSAAASLPASRASFTG